jgi:hypothetical protein
MGRWGSNFERFPNEMMASDGFHLTLHKTDIFLLNSNICIRIYSRSFMS